MDPVLLTIGTALFHGLLLLGAVNCIILIENNISIRKGETSDKRHRRVLKEFATFSLCPMLLAGWLKLSYEVGELRKENCLLKKGEWITDTWDRPKCRLKDQE